MSAFSDIYGNQYNYIPIIALSTSEMCAIEELPEKHKDILLPVIPLKPWLTSTSLSKSIERINKSIADRKWVATIDFDFIFKNPTYLLTGQFPRASFNEIAKLANKENGYQNWIDFLESTPNAIPTILFDSLEEVKEQIKKLNALQRGIVAYFNRKSINSGIYIEILSLLAKECQNDVGIIFDIGTIDHTHIGLKSVYTDLIKSAHQIIPFSLISISSTSFPSNFSGIHHGEATIYERSLFDRIARELTDVNLVYSDHGSARLEKQSGANRVPPPRIDYPLKKEWKFVREDFKDSSSITKEEKRSIYTNIASQIMTSTYWDANLHLWGTRMIEETAAGDSFGIDSAQKATAVRINIHLHNQLYYFTNDIVDTDEEWVD